MIGGGSASATYLREGREDSTLTQDIFPRSRADHTSANLRLKVEPFDRCATLDCRDVSFLRDQAPKDGESPCMSTGVGVASSERVLKLEKRWNIGTS